MPAEGNKILMWSKQLLLVFLGLTAGTATAAGTFAFIMIIGVIPRLVGKFRCAKATMSVENSVVLGGMAGSILSVFTIVRVPFSVLLLILFGLNAGIFVGGLAVALEEILDTFPILFRRLGIKQGMFLVMTFLAAGKFCGAILFFLARMCAS